MNDIACTGYENGDRVLWGGVKRKARSGSSGPATLAEWAEWCGRTWLKVSAAEKASAPNITEDFLRPLRLTSPHNSYSIAIDWGEHTENAFSDQFVFFGTTSIPLYLLQLGGRFEDCIQVGRDLRKFGVWHGSHLGLAPRVIHYA
ncbi:hypothetical protein [Bradyrhizobium sp. CCGE-LA001]|uniref:hypothetical protein n=1 Tax=Bradyrhizobium sp. CCGE-LA001 TaxID=1223566 RepID=UPI000745B9A4|nr:hypothetical protein [Bradyrhizobium sp. CCGE-LA001]AMA60178.1 hypothetical protein BCCGELA001_30750 [Bradyrhizobium sp. CCGE-LA001]